MSTIRKQTLRLAAALIGMVAVGSVVAARWEITGAAPEVTIETNTAGPSLRYPGTTGVWVTYSPSLSVDCGPPRGCYAKTQRIYYVFNCSPRYAMPMERISSDIGGSVIKRETRGDGDVYSADGDVGAFVILETYCPTRGSRDRR
jgi:hypothetical protein